MLFQNTKYSVVDVKPQISLWINKTKRSLQAQATSIPVQMKKRASRSVSCRGSATVEAALVLPVFLCGVCALIMIGQLLLVEGEIQHAVSKTAMICAKQESVTTSGKNTPLPVTVLETNAAFYSILQGSDLCSGCIAGGRHGILVSMKRLSKDEGRISVTASYSLKLPLPFLGAFRIMRKVEATRRMYTGYLLHKGESGAEDPLVYLAEHGSVYHTSLSCTHISLRISGNRLAMKMLEARGLRACEKCIKKGTIPQAYYITAEGDCYHSTVSCSGLKRTVRAVRLSEVKGMRICSRCVMKNGK